MPTDNENASRVLRTKEAAEFLGLREQTLRAKRQRGDGPKFVRLSKNRCGYRLAELERFLSEREFSSTAEAEVAGSRCTSERKMLLTQPRVIS
jgi:predicted DNA-binding transcriptional regulator AlpA